MDRPRTVLASLIAILLVLAVAFVLPFLEYFLLALLLAYVLRPIQRRLSSVVGERLAASAIVLLASITIVLPTVFVIRTAVEEARHLLRQIRTGAIGLERIESWILEVAGIEVDLSELLTAAANDVGVTALRDVFSLVGTLAHAVLGVGLTLFLLYYFLKDGDRFLAWLATRLPLRHEVRRTLFDETRNITRAVLLGHVLVAVIQGLIAGLGLWVLGVPNAAFWTVVMVVLAILPIIGSFLIWGPAVVWLFVVGRPIAALALLVYGTVVVGVSDDYLRPIVVDRYARINPAVIIIGVFGGVYVIGVMGIFFGPILLGALRVAIDVYDRDLHEASTAE